MDIEKVEIEHIEPVKSLSVNGHEVRIAAIKQYGSRDKDLMNSPYAIKNKKMALWSGKKFTPSTKGSVEGIVKVEIDGVEYYFGLSRTAMTEGT